MSFLNLRKNKKVATPEKQAVVSAPKKLVVSGETKKGTPNPSTLFIERPRVSEKATVLAGASCYVFEVLRTANKHQIAQAVKALYNVVPREVCVLPIPKKTLFVRGKKGSIGGGKKAYVFLKKGEKIEL